MEVCDHAGKAIDGAHYGIVICCGQKDSWVRDASGSRSQQVVPSSNSPRLRAGGIAYPELIGFVAHEVGKLSEVARKLGSRAFVRDGFLYGLIHTP